MRHVTWGLARARRHLANALPYQTSDRVDLKVGLTSPLGDRARTRNRIVHSCLAKRNRDRLTVVLSLRSSSLASGTTFVGGQHRGSPESRKTPSPPARGLHTRTSIVEPSAPPTVAGALVSEADSCLTHCCGSTTTSRYLEPGREKVFFFPFCMARISSACQPCARTQIVTHAECRRLGRQLETCQTKLCHCELTMRPPTSRCRSARIHEQHP